MSSEGLLSVLSDLYKDYSNRTPKRLKLVDVYLAYIMATGIIQFLYCLLVGTFPFNSFLAGFISNVGSFVLAGKMIILISAHQIGTRISIVRHSLFSVSLSLFFQPVCLRIQTNPQNKTQFTGISPERAFGDFIFASVVLHLVVINFIG